MKFKILVVMSAFVAAGLFLTQSLLAQTRGTGPRMPGGDGQMVLQNHNLKHISLEDPEVRARVHAALRKVVSETGSFTIAEHQNTIIVRDFAGNQNEVARILAGLDVGKEGQDALLTATLSLSFVEPSVVKKALEEAALQDETLAKLKVSHSDETKKLVLRGTAGQLEKARAIIAGLEKKFRTEVETKVYVVANRDVRSMAEIVKLHVPEGPGTGIVVDEITNSLIVRHTKASHEKVKELVSRFDTELATLMLEFRIIHASRDAAGMDESIKDVAEELKRMFAFTSYRAGQAPVFKVQQGHKAQFSDSGSGLNISFDRCDYDPGTGTVRIVGLNVSKTVQREAGQPSIFNLITTIKVKAGHTVVIGGASQKDARDALIVALKVTARK